MVIKKTLIWATGSIILSLLLIAMFLPFVPLPFGTEVLMVTTSGMKHSSENQNAFQIYWEGRGYNVSDMPFNGGIETGDMVIARKGDNYSVGDVTVYRIRPGAKHIKIHRIVEYNGTHFSTNNDAKLTPKIVKNASILTLAKCGSSIVMPDPQEPLEGCQSFNGTLVQYFYRMVDSPISIIRGKVIFRLPRFGILHVLAFCFRTPGCEPVQCLSTGECELMAFDL